MWPAASSGAMCDVSAADHDRDLALVVQVPAARRAHDVAAVRVQRRGRLVEVRGRGAELRRRTPRGGSRSSGGRRRSSWARRAGGARASIDPDPSAVGGDQLVAVSRDGDGEAVEQDPSRLHVVARIGRDAGAEGVHGPADARRTVVHRARRRRGTTPATSSRSSTGRSPRRVAALLARRRRPRRRTTPAPSRSSGPTGSRAATRGAELLDPVRSQYKECFVVVRCTWNGEHYSRCVYIWVDKDFALARGWYQGYPKKLGSIWMTRPVTVGKAGPRLEAGGRFGATLAANDRRLAEVSLTLTGLVGDGRLRERAADAALAMDAVDRPVAARRVERARHDAARRTWSSARSTPGTRRRAVRRAGRGARPRSRPYEMIAGYWRQVGATFAGGTKLA